MLKLEGYRLLRNVQWSMLLLIAVLSIGYALLTYTDAATSLGFSQYVPLIPISLTKHQLLLSIALLPSFLLIWYVYTIAYQDEEISTWEMLLPIKGITMYRIIKKEMVLLFLHALCLMPSVIVQQLLTGVISISFLTVLGTIHVLHFLGFHISCYLSANGFLCLGQGVAVVNVWKTCMPIFLLISILNIGEWEVVFYNCFPYLVPLLILLYFIFLYKSRFFLYRKIQRELILQRLINGVSNSQLEVLGKTYRDLLMRLLHFLFRILDHHHAGYWTICASIEVTIQQHMFSLGGFIFTFIYGILQQEVAICAFAFVFILWLYIAYRKEKQRIQQVRISSPSS